MVKKGVVGESSVDVGLAEMEEMKPKLGHGESVSEVINAEVC